MSAYTTSYSIRYQIPSLQKQIEVAVMVASQDIQNESASTEGHEDRIEWANWANKNSSAAWLAFAWPVAMNPSIQTAVESDPSGASVADTDVQFVVNSALPKVITDFVGSGGSSTTSAPPKIAPAGFVAPPPPQHRRKQ